MELLRGVPEENLHLINGREKVNREEPLSIREENATSGEARETRVDLLYFN